MNKAITILVILIIILLSYIIWSGKNYYKTDNTSNSKTKIAQEECNGTWEYMEEWDKYGTDLGKPICIPFEE